MSEKLTGRYRADLVHALRRLAETNRQAARDALSVGVKGTGLPALFKALSLADPGTVGPTARSVALSLRRQATRYEALIDKIPVETDPAVIAEIRTRAEQGLAECRAGWAEDGDKVLGRLFKRSEADECAPSLAAECPPRRVP